MSCFKCCAKTGALVEAQAAAATPAPSLDLKAAPSSTNRTPTPAPAPALAPLAITAMPAAELLSVVSLVAKRVGQSANVALATAKTEEDRAAAKAKARNMYNEVFVEQGAVVEQALKGKIAGPEAARKADQIAQAKAALIAVGEITQEDFDRVEAGEALLGRGADALADGEEAKAPAAFAKKAAHKAEKFGDRGEVLAARKSQIGAFVDGLSGNAAVKEAFELKGDNGKVITAKPGIMTRFFDALTRFFKSGMCGVLAGGVIGLACTFTAVLGTGALAAAAAFIGPIIGGALLLVGIGLAIRWFTRGAN